MRQCRNRRLVVAGHHRARVFDHQIPGQQPPAQQCRDHAQAPQAGLAEPIERGGHRLPFGRCLERVRVRPPLVVNHGDDPVSQRPQQARPFVGRFLRQCGGGQGPSERGDDAEQRLRQVGAAAHIAGGDAVQSPYPPALRSRRGLQPAAPRQRADLAGAGKRAEPFIVERPRRQQRHTVEERPRRRACGQRLIGGAERRRRPPQRAFRHGFAQCFQLRVDHAGGLLVRRLRREGGGADAAVGQPALQDTQHQRQLADPARHRAPLPIGQPAPIDRGLGEHAHRIVRRQRVDRHGGVRLDQIGAARGDQHRQPRAGRTPVRQRRRRLAGRRLGKIVHDPEHGSVAGEASDRGRDLRHQQLAPIGRLLDAQRREHVAQLGDVILLRHVGVDPDDGGVAVRAITVRQFGGQLALAGAAAAAQQDAARNAAGALRLQRKEGAPQELTAADEALPERRGNAGHERRQRLGPWLRQGNALRQERAFLGQREVAIGAAVERAPHHGDDRRRLIGGWPGAAGERGRKKQEDPAYPAHGRRGDEHDGRVRPGDRRLELAHAPGSGEIHLVGEYDDNLRAVDGRGKLLGELRPRGDVLVIQENIDDAGGGKPVTKRERIRFRRIPGIRNEDWVSHRSSSAYQPIIDARAEIFKP